MIKQMIDLSIPIATDTPIYPGDPKPQIKPATEIDKDGYQVSEILFGSHTGTHVDAPFHFQKNGQTIDQSDLMNFLGTGLVIDVTGKDDGEKIDMSDVEKDLARLEDEKIVLFHTGWSAYRGTEKYFRHPYICVKVIERLLEMGIRTFFIDALNIDPPDGTAFPAHEAITGVNGIIGENFCSFDQIDFPKPLIIALPLRLTGLDGSPVRAVAIELDVF
ncbi:cyclase family protein [Fictibacillus sp. WQ 8-8]|uniref:cyclase family protein n=1 Tax=Fictibacillus sp. WQ 8-8 TaxID=2938788 RepID=UPI00210EC03E|nr:cyclase family protein [Fictibacillus sp. WQ 8-8]MCQ6267816.1 cyclase family protein [Fictibacillus sp. WQ 8-8]